MIIDDLELPIKGHPRKTLETLALEVRRKHNLSMLHLFQQDIDGLDWVVFAHRKNPKGFQESVASGGGNTIAEALSTLDARLTAGPINKQYIPILDAEPKPKLV